MYNQPSKQLGFGEVAGSQTTVQILDLTLEPLGTYDTQFNRGYQDNINAGTINNINSYLEKTTIPTSDGFVMAGACEALKISDQIESQAGTSIIGGWTQPRHRFILKVATKPSQMLLNQRPNVYYVMGYTEHDNDVGTKQIGQHFDMGGFNLCAILDPSTHFVINNIIKVVDDGVNQETGLTKIKVTDSNYIVSDNPTDTDMTPSDPYMMPEERMFDRHINTPKKDLVTANSILSAATGLKDIPDNEISQTHYISTENNLSAGPQLVSTANSSPSVIMNNMFRAIEHTLAKEASSENVFGNYDEDRYAFNDFYNKSTLRIATDELGILTSKSQENPFLVALSKIRGNNYDRDGSVSYIHDRFTLEELIALDVASKPTEAPPINLDSRRCNYVDITDRSLIPQAGLMHGWGDMSIDTQVASIISRAVPPILLNNGIIGANIQASNNSSNADPTNPFGATVNIFNPKFLITDSADQIRKMEMLKRRIMIEVFGQFANYQGMGQLPVAFEMTISAGGSTKVRVSTYGGEFVPYIAPTFADALLIPSVTFDSRRLPTIGHKFSTVLSDYENILKNKRPEIYLDQNSIGNVNSYNF